LGFIKGELRGSPFYLIKLGSKNKIVYLILQLLFVFHSFSSLEIFILDFQMMMTYFILGLSHVLDYSAYDHMLFICIMLLGLSLKDWKKMLGLVSAFTVGHSLTLAFVVLYQPILDTAIVEFLIPITIMLTAVLKFYSSNKSIQNSGFIYATILFFGFIHGMGFANYLSVLLPSGENVSQMLFAFNIGIEVAQLIVGIIFLGLIATITFMSKHTTQIAQKAIAVVGVVISLLLAIENFPF